MLVTHEVLRNNDIR